MRYVTVYLESDKVLAITTEYRKSILFVRLEGYLISTTVSILEVELDKWMEEGIIKVVFNVKELIEIDSSGIQSLLNYSHIINNNNGYSLICGMNHHINADLKRSKILNSIYEISDELNAIKVMKWNNRN